MQATDLLNEFRLSPLILLICGISACSTQTDPRYDQRGTAPEGPHEVYYGPLTQAFRSVQDSPYRETCDAQNSGIQKKLITILDRNQQEVLKSSMNLPSPLSELIPFGKFNLIQKPKSLPRSGWQRQSYSWKIIDDYYEKNLKIRPQGFWNTLDTYVRSLITDDRKRVVYGYNLALDHEKISQLNGIRNGIESCITDTRCQEPAWSDEQKSLILSVPAYSHFQQKIEASSFKREKRRILEKFFNRISDDHILHRMEFNPMVSQKTSEGKRVFSIPLNPVNLTERDRQVLEKAIDPIWKNETNSFQLEWKTPSSPMDFFKFLMNTEPNTRSFVNFNLREVHLFPFTHLRTVAHEFGHVLGFSDHYYTLWDSENCEYQAEFNEEDIMSDSDRGEVTEKEWDTVIDLYENR